MPRRKVTKKQGSQISDESVPETRRFILGTGAENRLLSCMEDIAMLVFFLPIIIFEAMLAPNANEREADEFISVE